MSLSRNIRNSAIYFLIQVIRGLVYFTPLFLAQTIGLFLGFLSYYFLPRYRNIALENLRHVYVNKSDKFYKYLSRRVFMNQGKNLLELLFTQKLNKDGIRHIAKLTGETNWKALNSSGAIIVTGHFGNWELMAYALSSAGYILNVVARKVYIDQLNKILLLLRQKHNVRTILRQEQGSAKKILRALKRKEMIGVLIDQDIPAIPGMFANFLGKPALTPMGPIAIALKRAVPVVPAFIIRQKNGKHYIELLPPLKLVQSGSYEQDMKLNLEAINALIGKYIRMYPDHWVWFHERWKSTPHTLSLANSE